MKKNTDAAIVVTSINAPNPALQALAQGAAEAGMSFFVVGDTKSPPHFHLDGCRFYGVPAQIASAFSLASVCPTQHYSRKNIGYLLAMRDGASVIVETDDDNHPEASFFSARARRVSCRQAIEPGWTNVYRYFSDALVWPRGLPLDAINKVCLPYDELPETGLDCPIQQGLADGDPDVDAIYRLILPLPQRFRNDRAVALGRRVYCPFNSQNTSWWRDAFPLLYLPSHCSFRMCDIWRSFVAQRIAWENDWAVLFHGATMRHERNEHDLMQDFVAEIPGYANNRRIGEALDALTLAAGRGNIPDNLERCYRALVSLGVVPEEELRLLQAWQNDLANLNMI